MFNAYFENLLSFIFHVIMSDYILVQKLLTIYPNPSHNNYGSASYQSINYSLVTENGRSQFCIFFFKKSKSISISY